MTKDNILNALFSGIINFCQLKYGLQHQILKYLILYESL